MELFARRFGKKIRLPPTIQIKHQILLRWFGGSNRERGRRSEEGPLRETAWRRHAQRWRKGRPVIAGSELHLIGFFSKFLRTTTRCARYPLALSGCLK